MMIVLGWAVYCVLIAALLTLGAAAWERSARWSGGAARWGWLAAAVGSVTLPWLLRLVPERSWVEVMPAGVQVIRMEALTIAAATPVSAWSGADTAVLAWAVVSVLMLAYVGSLLLRLAKVSRRWRRVELEGTPVLMSESAGPAALGVRRGVVVLPAWVMSLDAELRGLLLRHERSHVEAGDPRMLLAGLLLLAAMPWNPLVWLQVLRLRNAIELDCDARVLGGGADPERYGSLLLEVGRRRSSHVLVMATFSEPRMFLEQRIRRIAKWPLERRRGRAVLFAAAALLLAGTAASARAPQYEAAVVDTTAPISDHTMVSDTPPAAPVFTPMTQAPQLLNANEVKAALERNYPPLLRDAGIGGTAYVHVFIDSLGKPVRSLISKSSDYPALDDAALAVIGSMKFSPALNRTKVVNVWVELPVQFNPGTGALLPPPPPPGSPPVTGARPPRPTVSPARTDTPPAPAPPRGIPGRPPTPPPPAVAGSAARTRDASPMDRAPELLNKLEVARALVRSYPPLLRDAGIGGRPTVWFHISADGVVQEVELAKPSGFPALDQAALSVARTMQFTPAQLDGKNIAVWVEIPILFTSDPLTHTGSTGVEGGGR